MGDLISTFTLQKTNWFPSIKEEGRGVNMNYFCSRHLYVLAELVS